MCAAGRFFVDTQPEHKCTSEVRENNGQSGWSISGRSQSVTFGLAVGKGGGLPKRRWIRRQRFEDDYKQVNSLGTVLL